MNQRVNLVSKALPLLPLICLAGGEALRAPLLSAVSNSARLASYLVSWHPPLHSRAHGSWAHRKTRPLLPLASPQSLLDLFPMPPLPPALQLQRPLPQVACLTSALLPDPGPLCGLLSGHERVATHTKSPYVVLCGTLAAPFVYRDNVVGMPEVSCNRNRGKVSHVGKRATSTTMTAPPGKPRTRRRRPARGCATSLARSLSCLMKLGARLRRRSSRSSTCPRTCPNQTASQLKRPHEKNWLTAPSLPPTPHPPRCLFSCCLFCTTRKRVVTARWAEAQAEAQAGNTGVMSRTCRTFLQSSEHI